MRSILGAIEQLRLDTGSLHGWDDDTPEGRQILRDVFNGIGDFPEEIRKKTHYLGVLTNPILYLTVVSIGPFLRKWGDENERGFGSPADTYTYADWDTRIPGTGTNRNNMNIAALEPPLAGILGIRPTQRGEYALHGMGPDGYAGAYENQSLRGIPNDVSNGLAGIGDIYMRSGGGVNRWESSL